MFTAFLESFVLALLLPVVISAASEEDEQRGTAPDRPFIADPDDQPSTLRDSWVAVQFIPEDFRIAAVHEMETMQETLPPGTKTSAMKWEGRNRSQNIYVESEAFIDGRHIREARQTFDSSRNAVLEMKLSDEGAGLFSQATREMVGRRVAVIFRSELHSVPLVRHEVTGGILKIAGLESDTIKYLIEEGNRRFLQMDPEGRRADARNIRMIAQASLIFANDNQERLPGNGAENIYDVARMLAEVGLNDASIWFSDNDGARSGTDSRLTTVLDESRASLHPSVPMEPEPQISLNPYRQRRGWSAPAPAPCTARPGLRVTSLANRAGATACARPRRSPFPSE